MQHVQITALSHLILCHGVHAKGKIEDRTAYLQRYPEEKLEIDFSKIDKIAKFDRVICHPRSSIAREQAIKGSDVDGGLFVTDTPIGEANELAVVNELRRQGFEVLHESEARPHNRHEVIEFRTHDEIIAQRKKIEVGSDSGDNLIQNYQARNVLMYYGGRQMHGNGLAREAADYIKVPDKMKESLKYFLSEVLNFNPKAKTAEKLFEIGYNRNTSFNPGITITNITNSGGQDVFGK